MQEWSSIIIIHVGMSAISSERRKLENFRLWQYMDFYMCTYCTKKMKIKNDIFEV
jgi:hypothetical protein